MKDIHMAGKKSGRDAETGRFIPVEKAITRPKTTVVETVKKPKCK